MIARFIPPTPNCGHAGSTFTHDPVRAVWLCVVCINSLGLMPSCHACGGPLPVTAALSAFASRICSTCQRVHRDARRS